MDFKGKCSHDENRRKVCGPCGMKIVFNNTSKKRKFLINHRTENLIKKYIHSDYNLSDSRYPLCICRSCYLTLDDAEKDVFKRPFQVMPDYSCIVLPKDTRSKNPVCNCYICLTGRFVGHPKTEKGRGHSRNLKNVINARTGQYGASDIAEPLKKVAPPLQKTTIKLCTKCGREIGKGLSHICSHKTNVLDIMKIVPESVQEQFASTIIRKKIDSGETANRHIKDQEVNLSTKGSKMRVVINPTKPKEIIFSKESLDNVKVNLNLSQNKMIKVTNFLRSAVGKNSVPSHYQDHMSKKSKTLKDIYRKDKFKFECEGKKVDERPVVYADAEELLEAVVKERGFEGNVLVKITADGGQGFFKICMSIFPENYSAQSESDDSNSGEETGTHNKRKRSLYSEGGTLSKRARLLSVKRVVILCIVPKIAETYENVKLLFDITNLNNIAFKFVSDFKLLLIINGQQGALAMYPCPYCFVSLNDLRKKNEPVQNNNCDNPHCSHSEMNIDDNSARRLKTYGDLRGDYEKFQSTGRNMKYTKDCHSTINKPLFTESDDTTVLEKCIVPELHLLQGFVNHIFWKGLVPLLGEETALLWPKGLGLISKSYHGNTFEGNACRKLLQNADRLNSPEIYKNVGDFAIVPYINAFKIMNKVVDCAFTSGRVGEGLEGHLNKLDGALDALEEVSETLKLHVLKTHTLDCIQYLENYHGLGYWSEQCGESVHREFLITWERHKINDIDNPSYADHLLSAVIEFSSLNI